MSMNPEHIPEMNPGTAGPDWEGVVEGAVAASIMLPFMQAIASKAGEDAYQVKNLIKRGNSRSSPEPVSLYDSSTDSELVFVPPLPDEAIKQLAGITPARLRSRVATWDADAGTWQISAFTASRDSDEMAPHSDADPWDDDGNLSRA